MKAIFTTRLLWLLWIATLSLFVAVWLFPVSDVLTRWAGCVLLSAVWLGLVALTWRTLFFRISLLAVSALLLCFAASPSRSRPGADLLRSGYAAGLRHYSNVHYYWGGESPKGIDCSGLIRRGLIDSLFVRGIQRLDPGLVREAIWLWWNDCTAKDLLEGGGFTTSLFPVQSINALDHSKIQIGDLAVTSWGSHIMAYLGDNLWIEADPGIGRVVVVHAPSRDNLWFHCKMQIVRWNDLAQ